MPRAKKESNTSNTKKVKDWYNALSSLQEEGTQVNSMSSFSSTSESRIDSNTTYTDSQGLNMTEMNNNQQFWTNNYGNSDDSFSFNPQATIMLQQNQQNFLGLGDNFNYGGSVNDHQSIPSATELQARQIMYLEKELLRARTSNSKYQSRLQELTKLQRNSELREMKLIKELKEYRRSKAKK